MEKVHDSWSAGTTYETFMGRWSRQLAPLFVRWLNIPRGVHWLDVGCGTGSLVNAICTSADPASVVGCDPAGPFIEFARAQSPCTRATFVIAGTGNLPHCSGGYESVTSLLALNFFPDPVATINELKSVTAPQGTVSACVWDYSEGMEFLHYFWKAATAVDPAAKVLDEGPRFPLCHPDALATLFRNGGLEDVRCEPIEIPTPFASFNDYWHPFLGGTGPAPSYVASLDADVRALIVQKLEEALSSRRGPDGTIQLTARAWAVRSTVHT